LSGRYVVMVDAGFLRAEGAKELGIGRDTVTFDGAACVEWFADFVRDPRFAAVAPIFAGRALLRAYWYDGAFDPRDRRYRRQRAVFDGLALVPGLYLRLGHVQERRARLQHGIQKAVQACGVSLVEFEKHFEFRLELQQKGVDALMTLDLVQLSRDRVADAVLLISGDRDLEEAVRIAQGTGCKVVVAHPRNAGVALGLRQLADALVHLDATDLATMLVRTDAAPSARETAPVPAGPRSARTP
jgi:uncharacterized LabA/DUF88 family protein